MANETAKIDLPPNVLEYMHEQKTLTLATASPVAVPHARDPRLRRRRLARCTSGLVPRRTTAQQIGQNPVVSFAIDEYSSDWRETKGIQGAGNCQVAPRLGRDRPGRRVVRAEVPVARRLALERARVLPDHADRAAVHRQQRRGRRRPGLGSQYHRDLVYSIFHDLPQQEVETVEAQLRTVEFAEGDVIVRQGAPADKFFIIVDGEVEVVRESEGKTRSLGTLGRGQFFGEIAILRDTPRIATVRAVKPTTLFAMERDVFRSRRRPVDGHDRRLRPRHPAASGGARPHDRRLRRTGRWHRGTSTRQPRSRPSRARVQEHGGRVRDRRDRDHDAGQEEIDDDFYGMTANAFSSVSLDPPLVLICVISGTPGAETIERNGVFAVNVLGAHQEPISRFFSSRDRPAGRAAFADLPHFSAVTGSPILERAAAYLDCRVTHQHEAGDHLIFIGEVVALGAEADVRPLLFHGGKYAALSDG